MGRSPVYRSKGRNAVFAVEAAGGATCALHVFVEHSDEREKEWSVAASFPSMTGYGVSEIDVTGIKELYRLSWEFLGLAEDVTRVRFAEPVWRLSRGGPECPEKYADSTPTTESTEGETQ